MNIFKAYRKYYSLFLITTICAVLFSIRPAIGGSVQGTGMASPQTKKLLAKSALILKYPHQYTEESVKWAKRIDRVASDLGRGGGKRPPKRLHEIVKKLPPGLCEHPTKILPEDKWKETTKILPELKWKGGDISWDRAMRETGASEAEVNSACEHDMRGEKLTDRQKTILKSLRGNNIDE